VIVDQRKGSSMENLRQRAADVAGSVCAPESPVVWGEGSLDSPVVFVGEAPAARETRDGRPFVGPAGRLLTRELEMVGIERESVWMTNLVKCRPIAISRTGAIVNREPRRHEIDAWLPILEEELQILGPRLVVCLGAPAARALIRKDFAITRERGELFDKPGGKHIMATFHPSYVLRAPAAGGTSQAELFRRDLSQVKRLLDQG